MSRITNLSRRTKRIILGVAAVAVVGAVAIPATGADYSASDSSGSVQMNMATMSLNLSDADHSHTFALNFPNLAPGGEVSDTFTVKNTGSIAGTVKITGFPGLDASGLSGLTAAQIGQLHYSIDGYSNPMDLGTLNAGESRTYNVRVGLARVAGDQNYWQGRTLSTHVTVTLNQV